MAHFIEWTDTKFKYISELQAAQVNVYPATKLIFSTKLQNGTPQKAIKLIARREPLTANESTIKFVRYKCGFLSLILLYV